MENIQFPGKVQFRFCASTKIKISLLSNMLSAGFFQAAIEKIFPGPAGPFWAHGPSLKYSAVSNRSTSVA